MRKASNTRPFLIFIVVFTIIFAIPTGINEILRASGTGTIRLLSLPGRGLKAFGNAWLQGFLCPFGKGAVSNHRKLKERLAALEVENHSLKNRLQQLDNPSVKTPRDPATSIAGKVITRDPSSWSSSLWVNVGERDNEKAGTTIIAKNSPVLSGNSLIGIVDEVMPRKSKIRLLTDSSVTPSVRVARGDPQRCQCLAQVEMVKNYLSHIAPQYLSVEELDVINQNFTVLQDRLQKTSPTLFLAKGELYGTSQPLWRSLNPTLKGTGFNYDFEDDKGPARDLRTGSPIPANPKYPPTPLIKEDDLLVTTGMDGLFPANMSVAIVSHVEPLKEGSYFYEITAKPTAGNPNTLDHVLIIPPQSPVSNAWPVTKLQKG